MMSDIGLLETLRVRMLAGRALAPGDLPGTPVAVVDQRFAEVFLNGRNPVGEHFTLFRRSWEVIGMAATARFLDVREQGIPTVYFPFNPEEFLPGPIHIAFRSAIGPDQLSTEVRRVVASVDRAVPVTEFHTQSGLIDRELRTERLLAFLSGGFGLIALVLAAIGLGGLLAYVVARRTSEIGVRMALGAAPADVIRMVLRDSLSMIVFGLLFGRLHRRPVLGSLAVRTASHRSRQHRICRRHAAAGGSDCCSAPSPTRRPSRSGDRATRGISGE
jgi:hypothetical protein